MKKLKKTEIKEEINNNIYSNSGKQGVYAGGWIVGDEKHLYYLGDKGCENKDSLIKTMIIDIFNSGYSKENLYAHNLSRFDGHFITNYLLVLNSLPIVLTGYAITLLNNANIEGQAIVFCNSLLMM